MSWTVHLRAVIDGEGVEIQCLSARIPDALAVKVGDLPRTIEIYFALNGQEGYLD